jgi:rfaE bifunctional protein nucleotidyltransferase chain/domain
MMSYMFEGDIGDKWDKGNLPEISQVSPVDHLKYFENHPQIKNPKKTIWINGCFDVLHAGHIEMIKYAHSLGQRLVVGLDTDARVQEFKGISRPINTYENRKRVMEAIRYVDEVVPFGTDDELIAAIRNSNAHTIVVGEEYKGRVIGSEIVENITYFPRMYDLSTTKIISK